MINQHERRLLTSALKVPYFSERTAREAIEKRKLPPHLKKFLDERGLQEFIKYEEFPKAGEGNPKAALRNKMYQYYCESEAGGSALGRDKLRIPIKISPQKIEISDIEHFISKSDREITTITKFNDRLFSEMQSGKDISKTKDPSQAGLGINYCIAKFLVREYAKLHAKELGIEERQAEEFTKIVMRKAGSSLPERMRKASERIKRLRR